MKSKYLPRGLGNDFMHTAEITPRRLLMEQSPGQLGVVSNRTTGSLFT
jgi:hypothetical protein